MVDANLKILIRYFKKNVMSITKTTCQILTEKTERHLFAELILPCFIKGENITAVWVPHSGKRRSLIYLSQNSEKFGFEALGKYKIIYIDHGELIKETPRFYFKLMLKGLLDNKSDVKEENAFFVLKEKIKEFTKEGTRLIFILGGFDEIRFSSSFFNNLKNIWEIDKLKIHYLFPVTQNILNGETFRRYGKLRELISQNVVFFPLFSAEDSLFVIKYFEKKYGYKINAWKRKIAISLSGGHPSLIKACLRILNNQTLTEKEEIIENLNQQWEIKMILEDIWTSFGEDEKNLLKQISQKIKTNNPLPEWLLKLRIVIPKEKSDYALFSPLFEYFVKKQKLESKKMEIEPKTGEILINGRPPSEKITLQEYRLLINFLQKANIIISRDQIASILWDKEADEKYSDWAIDQIMSQLRKKLNRLGISGKKLQTIRNRGYRWLET